MAITGPPKPSLRDIHVIVAKDPRAHAKLFLFMNALHYRYIVGVERLDIGRRTLARPATLVHNDIAASLQPCLAPGTTDVQAPLEAQRSGFTRGHGKGHSILGPTKLWP